MVININKQAAKSTIPNGTGDERPQGNPLIAIHNNITLVKQKTKFSLWTSKEISTSKQQFNLDATRQSTPDHQQDIMRY